MISSHAHLSLKLPRHHVVYVVALACIVTAVLFTRCCGQFLSPVAPLLIIPYLLGSFVSIFTLSALEILGFAIGLAIELMFCWWLIRAALILASRVMHRRPDA